MSEYYCFTTFPDIYWDFYAKKMVESYVQYFPKDCDLHVYVDTREDKDFKKYMIANNVHVYHYYNSCPDLIDFKNRNYDRTYNNFKPFQQTLDDRNIKSKFRWQAYKFAYKAFVIIRELQLTRNKKAIWLDADMFFDQTIDYKWLDYLLNNKDIAFMDRRPNRFPETGFVIWDTESTNFSTFLYHYKKCYENDHLFNLREWHDAVAFEYSIIESEKEGLETNNLSLDKEGKMTSHSHVQATGILAERMDHIKGKRKEIGYSAERVK